MPSLHSLPLFKVYPESIVCVKVRVAHNKSVENSARPRYTGL
jgi:hypothetical protein